jgi:hypothetical protein
MIAPAAFQTPLLRPPASLWPPLMVAVFVTSARP